MSKKLNLARVYADVEDHLIPTLRLDPYERALYYHLLRHTRLAGKRKMCASRRSLAYSSGFCHATIHRRIQGLERKGCARVAEWTQDGKLIEILLPSEIPGCVRAARTPRREDLPIEISLKDPKVRGRLVRRERGLCFYCLRPLKPEATTIDHVIPVSRGGTHHEHNLVACCWECNHRKREEFAQRFFARLHAEKVITGRQLSGRLRALRALKLAVRSARAGGRAKGMHRAA